MAGRGLQGCLSVRFQRVSASELLGEGVLFLVYHKWEDGFIVLLLHSLDEVGIRLYAGSGVGLQVFDTDNLNAVYSSCLVFPSSVVHNSVAARVIMP